MLLAATYPDRVSLANTASRGYSRDCVRGPRCGDDSRSCWVRAAMSVPLAKYWRRRPLVSFTQLVAPDSRPEAPPCTD